MFIEGLTFDHDHVDVDGADQRLRKSFSSLQNLRDFSSWNHVIRFGTKSHQLPDGHPWKQTAECLVVESRDEIYSQHFFHSLTGLWFIFESERVIIFSLQRLES